MLSSFACIAGLRVVHSETSKLSFKKTILVAQVDIEYLESGLFRNWFKHAVNFIPNGSAEIILDTGNDTNVDKYLKKFDFGNIPFRTVAEMMSLEFAAIGPWGSASYKDLMSRRPQVIKRLLEDGHFVFQFDVDTVWAKNPFTKFDEAGNHDLLVTRDIENSSFVCGCLLYFRPSVRTVAMAADWVKAIKPKDPGNQYGLNRILRRNKNGVSKNNIDVSFLEYGDFPSGLGAHRYPNATIYHANWMKGIRAKKKFFNDRNLWTEE